MNYFGTILLPDKITVQEAVDMIRRSLTAWSVPLQRKDHKVRKTGHVHGEVAHDVFSIPRQWMMHNAFMSWYFS